MHLRCSLVQIRIEEQGFLFELTPQPSPIPHPTPHPSPSSRPTPRYLGTNITATADHPRARSHTHIIHRRGTDAPKCEVGEEEPLALPPGFSPTFAVRSVELGCTDS